ncbi:MAG: hypothetical protein UY04_C0010G0006 [Parcubacteria group bacterium GW2011_GWA2_47_7]|nr:MAG: hypothetical protein UY04_C0010G0006 [Parcubacteria group bacterium GW2011_GWA2_47_7]
MINLRKPFLWLIRLYQKLLSPDTGLIRLIIPFRQTCNMYPTCSEYTYKAIEKYGVFRGIYKGFFRILRCHPYQKKLIDEP